MRTAPIGHLRTLEPTTRRERLRGLTGRDALDPDEGLLLCRCRSVHTFGMRIPIDVVLLDRAMRPIRVRTLPPGRLFLPRPQVRHVLETAAGSGPRFAQAIQDPVPGALPWTSHRSPRGRST